MRPARLTAPAALALSLLLPAPMRATVSQSAGYIDRVNNLGQAGRAMTSASYLETGEAPAVGISSETSTGYSGGGGHTAQRPLPATISDLSVTAVSSSTLSIQWTAPYADVENSTGTAAQYLIRYAQANAIDTDIKFADAVNVSHGLTPQKPTLTETYQIGGLAPNVAYSIVVEAVNDAGVQGERCAASSATTTSPPAPADPEDRIHDLALAPNGSLYAVGQSSRGPPGLDFLIARYDAAMALVSSTTFNGDAGSGHDVAYSVVVDSKNIVFAAGYTTLGNGTLQTWLASFDANLNLISSTTVGETAAQASELLHTDAGKLLLAGTAVNGANTDIWLAQFDKALVFQASAAFNTGLSPSLASGHGLALDLSGNIYLAGDLPPSAGAPTDIWIGKYDSSLVFITSATQAGGGGTADGGASVAVGPNGDVFAAGEIDNGGPNLDAWLGRFNASLALQQSITVDGSAALGSDAAYELEIGNAGNVVLAGQATESAGAANAWYAEYSRVLVLQSSATFDGAGGTDAAYTVALDTTANTAYVAGQRGAANPDIWISSFTIAPPPSACSDLSSIQSGPWSALSTWYPPFIPTACNAVTVSPGDIVSLDVSTGTASTTTILGTLYFDRVENSSLTIVAGDLTVGSGGHLDMGTSGDAIPSGIKAELVLALGSTAGEFGLIVSPGGDFTARGAAKYPYGFAVNPLPAGEVGLLIAASSATGWAVGDDILIGPTAGNGTATAETRTITSITGTNPLTISWSGGLAAARTQSSTTPIVAANLSRNVSVRSAGTDSAANAAYVRNLATNATSFAVVDALFSELGANASGKYGVTFDGGGVAGSISSAVFRGGFNGLRFSGSSSHTLVGLVFHAGADAGLVFDNASVGSDVYGSVAGGNGAYGILLTNGADHNRLANNHAFSNTSAGILVSNSRFNHLRGNRSYANGVQGIWLQSADSNTLLDNNVYTNASTGLLTDSGSDNNMLIGNPTFANASHGLRISGGANLLARGNTFANSGAGLFIDGAANAVFANGGIGYNAQGAAFPNTAGEVMFNAGGVENLTLKAARVHPAGGIATTGFDTQGTYLLSYHQDYATGTARFYGSHEISGSTWTFDYTAPLYASTATVPRAMRGPNHSLAVTQTYDATVVSQLITFEYRDNQWHVDGSSSGVDMHIFAGNLSGIDIPAASPLFRVNFTGAATPLEGDRLEFALVSTPQDSNKQKRFLFGPAASSLNAGRSKLTVAPSGGLQLLGANAAYTVMDRLNSAATYYSFVSSGAFSARLSSMTNMDGNGIQLSGSAGVLISTAAFDYLGITGATNSYLTVRNLTSNATFYSIAFGMSRDFTAAPFPYNVRVEGANPALAWLFFQSTGAYKGESFDGDPGGLINWADGATRPGTPVGTTLGISSVTWSWTASADAASYNVYRASEPATLLANPSVTTLDEVALETNTAYGIFIEPLHVLGGGPLTPTATIYTLAMPPTGAVTTQIEGSSAAFSWNSNTNPAHTLADIQRSTDNATFTTIATGAVTSYTDFGLLGCTTYYFRIRNLNGDGVPTDFAAIAEFQTLGSTPLAPSGLTAESLSGRRVALNWTPSPDALASQYRLYFDGGTEVVNYSAPLAVFTSTVTTFTTNVLTSSAAYTFGLRAKNSCGTEETNFTVTATAGAADALPDVRASIRSPRSGQKIAGDRVTIAADITQGAAESVSKVLFQYKHSTDTVWIDIPPASDSNPNPDTTYPYLVHWDVKTLPLPATGYNLRAVATDRSAAADPAPPSVLIEVDPANWDINENSQAGGARVKLQQVINNGALSSVRAADPSKAQVTRLSIPAGALNESTKTVTITNNPTTTPAARSDVTPIGTSVEITLTPSQTDLSGGQTATLSIGYPDEDGDGFVDGTSVRASELKIYYYDAAAGSWTRDFASTADTRNRTVTGETPHFSIFALFAPKHSDLGSILVYPVPYRPNNTLTDDGVPYASGNPNSGIIFDLLPEGTSIKIYTLAGQLVTDLNSVASGRIQWDARNRDGRDVATGGYVAVIKSGGQEAIIRKLLIIR
ncbi:MAG: fibronectin type III domain-containing protein [Elusimicrobiota bacterium]